MKRFILFFITFCFLLSYVLAEPVDSTRALQVAKSFVPQSSSPAKNAPKKGDPMPSADIIYTHKMPKSGRNAFYIVNVGDAFVLVGADDVAHPILGYSFNNSFPVAADGTVQLPPHVKGFFDDLAAQIEAAIEAEPNRAADDDWSGARKAKTRRAPSNLPESVGPLLTTTWDQGQYYNTLCPEDANGPAGHVWTGCVATAMAQIIKYWGEPVHGRGIHSYESNYGTLEVNFENSIYDFANMPDALTGENTAEQVNAVAKLMYDCGVAVNMGYAAGESDAFDQEARAGLINFFRFSPDLSFAEKAYFSNEDWNNLLRQNLAANCPVYYSGQGTGGHAFVCDGYEADDYYHFNFGWGGVADGWFLTSAVSPNDKEFNSSQSAIVGIVPDNTGNVILGQMQGTSTFVIDEPLEFYHLMGHNKYEGSYYTNSCNNTVTFLPEDESKQMVIDVVEFESQEVILYDGYNTDNYFWSLTTGGNNYLNPVVSPPSNVVTLTYNGSLSSEGFQLCVGYEDDCRYVSNVSIHNTMIENEIGVSVDWLEKGGATQWEVRYRRHDMRDSPYTIISTDNHPCIITDLLIDYKYDFSVRAVHDQNHKSGWSADKTFKIDIPYWTDMVTEQPAGFIEDVNGNIKISSPEGLAWLSVLVNGFHGHQPYSFEGKTVTLTADIDLEGYRWYPMGRYLNWNWTKFSGTFDGQEHAISNIYVCDASSNLGLFGRVDKGRIKNIFMDGGSVSSTLERVSSDPQYWLPSSSIGGLMGEARACYEISNCHSSVNVSANGGAGSLIGMIWTYETDDVKTIVSNCSSTGSVTGREVCGGLIGGIYGDVEVRNSYSTSDVFITECDLGRWYIGRGGLFGSIMQHASVYNCYSTGIVYDDANYNNPIGNLIGYNDQSTKIHYMYGRDDINQEYKIIGSGDDIPTDVVLFHHDGNTNALLTAVTITDKTYNDLLEALNARVALQNDQNINTWVLDNNTGYPIFGDNFEPSCYNPTNILLSNATEVGNPIIRTKLAWEQVGEPDHWEVLYVASEHDIDEGMIVTVDSNPCVLTDIPVGKPLDFYLRSVNNDGDKSNWSSPITYIPDKLRWTEVVTSQPEGYREDENGNIFISSAEGLAWLSSVVNEINGAEYNEYSFYSKRIELTADIDISSYRWTPIGGKDWWHQFHCALFTGNNHVISGLYCNELSNYQGLFGLSSGGSISDLTINQSNVFGEEYVGALVGYSAYDNITNCMVNGNVCGIQTIGGLVGWHLGGNYCSIENSCFIGTISSRYDITKTNTYGGYVGGICGVPFNDTIANCYVVSEITDDGVYSGVITGTGGSPEIVSNCYYKNYETSLPITSDNCTIANNSSFSGSGNTWTLTTPPYIGELSYTDLVDALNAWVDANNSEGQYRHWSVDTENVNSGFPVFAPLYTLTYKVNGDIYMTSTLEAGAALPAIAEPTKDGYVFGGWSEIPATMPAHDVEVTGTFYLYGDVNTDTKVNVVDVVDIARFVVATPSENFREKLADLNSDLSVNIADAVALVNHIAGDQNFVKSEFPMSKFCDYESCNLKLQEGEMNELLLCLTGDADFTAFQFEVEVPEGIDISAMRINSLRKDGHQLLFNRVADNRYRVAALSLSNAVFKGNDGELLNISLEGMGTVDVCIHDIHFVTTTGTDIVFDNLYLNGNTTGMANIHVKENAPIYDLQGRRHSTLQRGANIIGNRKIIVK